MYALDAIMATIDLDTRRYMEQSNRIDDRAIRTANRIIAEQERVARQAQTQAQRVIDEQNRAMQAVERTRQQVISNMKSVGDSISSAGKSLTVGLTLPILGLGGAMVKAGADYEKGLSNIKAVSNASITEMQQISKLTLQLGKDTQFSATEAAKGAEELIKAGVEITDVLGTGLKGALTLAAAGEIELEEAAKIASTALNAFKQDGLDVPRVADIMAGAANASAASIGELSLGLSQVSAVASGAGISFDDTATSLALFANNGLKGSDAGTSLKTMLLNLQPTTDAQISLFEQLGLVTEDGGSKFFDSSGKIKSMADISEILQTSLGGLTDAQRLQAMEVAFGSDAMRAANILYKSGEEGITAMKKAMGNVTAEEVAAEKMNNFYGQVEILKGAAETLAINLGTTLLPAMKDITSIVQDATETFSNLSPETQKVILVVAGLAAAVGPLLVVIGGLISVAGTVVGAIAAISAPMIAVGAVISTVIIAIGSLIAVFVALYRENEELRNKMDATWEMIKEKMITVFGKIKELAIAVFGALKRFWEVWGDDIVKGFSKVWDVVSMYLEMGLNNIIYVLNIFIGIFNDDWEKVWQNTKSILVNSWNVIISIFENVASLILKSATKIWSALKDYVIFKLQELVIGVANQGTNLYSAVVGMFTSALSYVKQVVANSGIMGAQFVSNFIAGIARTIPSVGTVKKPLDGAVSGLGIDMEKHGGKAAKDNIYGFMGEIQKNSPLVKKSGGDTTKAFAFGMGSSFKDTSVSASGLINNVIDKLSGGGAGAEVAGKKIDFGLGNGIKKNAKAVKDEAKKVADAIKEEFDNSKQWIDDRKYYNELSLQQELDAWKKIQGKYKQGTDQRREADREVYRVQKEITAKIVKDEEEAIKKKEEAIKKKEEAEKKSLDNSKKWIDEKKYFNELSLQQELEAWQRVQARYKEGTDERMQADKEIYRVQKELTEKAKTEKTKLEKDTFDNSMKWIEEKKYYNQLTAKEEIEGYERILAKSITTAEQRKTVEREIYRVRKQLIDDIKKIEESAIAEKTKYDNDVLQEEKKKKEEEIKIEKDKNKAIKDEEERASKEYQKIVDDKFESIEKATIDYNKAVVSLEKNKNKEIEKENKNYENERQKIQDEQLKAENEAYKKFEDEKLKIAENTKTKIESLETEYHNKYLEMTQKSMEEVAKLDEIYNTSLEKKTESLYSFMGVFDEVQAKEKVSGQQLIKNLNNQIKSFDDWQDDIQKLVERGMDVGVVQELKEMGPKAGAQIEALTELSDEELTVYTDLWKQKHEQAREEAIAELEGLRKDTDTKIKQIQVETSTNLTALVNEYDTKNKKINEDSVIQLDALKLTYKTKQDEILTETDTKMTAITKTHNDNLKQVDKDAEDRFVEIKGTYTEKLGEIETTFKNSTLAFETGHNDKLKKIDEDAVEKFNTLKETYEKKLGELKTASETKLDELKGAFKTKFGEIQKEMTDPIDAAALAIKTTLDNIKADISNVRNTEPVYDDNYGPPVQNGDYGPQPYVDAPVATTTPAEYGPQLPAGVQEAVSSGRLNPNSPLAIYSTGFAEGGIVTKPTFAMIGEAGESEAVIPLSKLSDMIASTLRSMTSYVTGGNSSSTVNNSSSKNEITINQYITDKKTADYATDSITKIFQRRGLGGSFI